MTTDAFSLFIGAGITLGTTALTQYIMYKKEQRQWENQQKAEEKTWKRNEKKKEQEQVREAYQNSLSLLSSFIGLSEQSLDEQSLMAKKLEIASEVNRWVSLLVLRHPNENLHNSLAPFSDTLTPSWASMLREDIVKLKNKEDVLFWEPSNDSTAAPEEPIPQDEREIRFDINNEYRRLQLIDGVEIPKSHTFKHQLTKLTNSQREKLADQFFNNHGTIPEAFSLYVPTCNIKSKRILLTNERWQARLNPKENEIEEILIAWEDDYNKGLEEANGRLESIKEKDQTS